MKTFNIPVLLIVATFVSTALADATAASLDKLKDDKCFSDLEALSGRSGEELAGAMCPGTPCGPKIDDLIKTLVISDDNKLALYGHVLAFRRDIGCINPATLTGDDKNKPVTPSGSGPTDSNVNRTLPSTCAQAIDQVYGRGSMPRLFSFAGVQSSLLVSKTTGGNYLTEWSNSINYVQRSARNDDLCDPATCLFKYMQQWHAWLYTVPGPFLANIPPDAALRQSQFTPESVGKLANDFGDEISAKCAQSSFKASSVRGARLEVNLQEKKVTKSSSVVGARVNRVVMFMMSLVCVVILFLF